MIIKFITFKWYIARGNIPIFFQPLTQYYVKNIIVALVIIKKNVKSI